jgi:type I restriction enzyme, S subunit
LSTDRSYPLPPGWSIQPLASVCAINPKKPATDALKSSDPVTFVPMPAVDADAGAITAPLTRAFASVRKGFTAFANEDVIVAKITPCFENGKAALCRGLTNGLGFGSTEFHVLRCTDTVIPEYVYHFVRQESFRRDGEANMTGSVGQKRVPADWLKAVEIPLAPLAEQRRVVAKVDAVLARVNAARDRLAKVPALLRRFRQSVLAAACLGKLTAEWREQHGHADEWPSVKLGAIGEISGGITKNATRKSLTRQVPYLRVANVYQNRLELDEVLKIGVTDAEFKRTVLKTGDLLFVEGNGSVDQIGRVARWDGSVNDCVHQNHLIRFRAPAILDSKFVLLAMMSPPGREQLMNHAISSAGLHSLSISKIAACDLSLPPVPEQHEIVRRAEALFALADKIEARVTSASARGDKLIQSTLAKAFRGELVPTEHALAEAESRSYETAQQLVSRIQNAPAVAAIEDNPTKNNESVIPVATKQNVKVETTLAKKKHSKGIFFKRAAIASYAVGRLHSKDTFGRIQLEKLLYLCEAHLGIDLEGEYKRQAAGPLDADIYKIESLARKYKWFDSRKRAGFGIKYLPGTEITDRTGAARTLLGAKTSEMDRLLGWFEKMTTEQAEVFATVFAAWNDLLIDGANANEDQIIEQVRQHWHASKERFTPQRLRDCISWIQSNHFSPRGIGSRTMVPSPERNGTLRSASVARKAQLRSK